MAIRNRMLVNLAGRGVARLCRLWMRTIRLRIIAEDYSLDPRSGGKGNIYCMWHENMFYLGYLFRDLGVNVLISRSGDGELITTAMESLGYKTVRGSTNRGGARAALEIVRLGKEANLSMTPDGPRGPRRQFQDGAVYMASRSGMPLVPVGIAFDRPWRFSSWDRLALPRPFSRAVLCSTRPLHIPADANPATLAEYQTKIAQLMAESTEKAELLVARWTATGRAPERSPEARAAAAAATTPFRKSA